MTLTSNYIRTENNGRLRCHRAPAVAYRQLEASVGAVVVVLMLGFVAMLSQQGQSNAAARTASLQQPSQAATVRTSVRVIPMYAPQSAVLVQTDRRS